MKLGMLVDIVSSGVARGGVWGFKPPPLWKVLYFYC